MVNLKPDNIGFSGTATSKLFDFGLANLIGRCGKKQGWIYNLTRLREPALHGTR
jgi:hypothetical protein